MWPHIGHESHDWARDPEDLLLIPKSRRRTILPTYEAALPPLIASAAPELPVDLQRRAAEACVQMSRFDQSQIARGYNLPALMLRSESSSSSQIERLTSSVRNVALADLTDKVPENARLIAKNVYAMREALSGGGSVDVRSVLRVHAALMGLSNEESSFRDEPVWIGGSLYSPHGAAFVPPHASRIDSLMEDLVAFGMRDDVAPLVKAALFHAQFETIHPFTDGNGRTGRALIHRMLASDEILRHSSLPLSAGLLHDVDRYMRALDAYHEGGIEPIVECFIDAAELAVVVGSRVAADVDDVIQRWEEALMERRGSAIRRLPALLVEHPVVDAAFAGRCLGITDRAARNLMESACEKGMLATIGNARRGVFYYAPMLIDVLEEASSTQGIMRIAAR